MCAINITAVLVFFLMYERENLCTLLLEFTAIFRCRASTALKRRKEFSAASTSNCEKTFK